MTKKLNRVEIVDANLSIVSLQQHNYSQQGYTVETPIEITGWIYRCVMVKETEEDEQVVVKPKGRPKMDKEAEVA